MIKRLLIISALALLTVTSAATVCAEDNGYIFELKDDAVVPMSVTEGVERICDEKAVYKADSLADIYSFVSPSAIENLGRNIPVYLFDDGEADNFTDTPNDYFYVDKHDYQWNLKQIKMPKVWAKGYRGEGATVCVIDSGLNLEHNDLDVKRVVGKYNIFNGSDDVTDFTGYAYRVSEDGTYVESDGVLVLIDDFIAGGGVVTDETVRYERVRNGHGTLVTGVINAVTNNGKGIAGIADKSDIVVIKAFDDEDSEEYKTDVTTLISALEYTARNYPEVDVINMSLGTTDNMDDGTKRIFQKAIDAVVDKGIIVVAAVGNGGSSMVSYPAGFDNVIGVGGTSANRIKCEFSQFNESVFVCAPGGIESSTNRDKPIVTLNNTGSDIVTTSGTSFAAPQVAAVAAIAKSIYPELTTNQFKEILKKTSEDLTEAPPYFDKETVLEQFGDLKGYDEFYGYGLIDVDKIIEEAERLAEKAPFEYNADNYRVLEYINDGEEKGVVVETDDLNASVYIASYDDDNVLSSVRRVDISDLESGTDNSNNYCRYQIPILENEAEPSKLFLWHGMIGCKTWEMQTAE